MNLALLPLLSLLVQAPNAGNAAIEGSVLRNDNSQPIAGARVVVGDVRAVLAATGLSGLPSAWTPPTGAVGLSPSATVGSRSGVQAPPSISILDSRILTVTTDADGKFALRDVTPGTYALVVDSPGYVRQEHGQRVPGTRGTPLVVSAGQTLKDVTIRLLNTGSISGRIRDAAGRPVAGIATQLYRSAYNAEGQRVLQPVGGARTDDRGEYRIYWITPGRYYLVAGSSLNPGSIGFVGGNPNVEQGIVYANTYYPGVPELSAATLVTVAPGSDHGGIDFALSPPQPTYLEGRVAEPSGRLPGTLAVSLLTSVAVYTGDRNYDAASGIFKWDVIPGKYMVTAISRGTPQLGAFAAVDVSAGGLAGIALNLTAPRSVSGRILVEGQPLPQSPEQNRLRVQFDPALGGIALGRPNPTPMTRKESVVDADGTFTVVELFPGDYRINVVGLPAGALVSSMRSGPETVQGRVLQIRDTTGSLEIVVKTSAGEISGMVRGSILRPAAGVDAVLIPDKDRDRPELYRTVSTDAAGRFVMQNVPAGDYKVFAWEALEPFGYFDPDLLRRSEAEGSAVHVTAASQNSVEVRLVAADGR